MNDKRIMRKGKKKEDTEMDLRDKFATPLQDDEDFLALLDGMEALMKLAELANDASEDLGEPRKDKERQSRETLFGTVRGALSKRTIEALGGKKSTLALCDINEAFAKHGLYDNPEICMVYLAMVGIALWKRTLLAGEGGENCGK